MSRPSLKFIDGSISKNLKRVPRPTDRAAKTTGQAASGVLPEVWDSKRSTASRSSEEPFGQRHGSIPNNTELPDSVVHCFKPGFKTAPRKAGSGRGPTVWTLDRGRVAFDAGRRISLGVHKSPPSEGPRVVAVAGPRRAWLTYRGSDPRRGHTKGGGGAMSRPPGSAREQLAPTRGMSGAGSARRRGLPDGRSVLRNTSVRSTAAKSFEMLRDAPRPLPGRWRPSASSVPGSARAESDRGHCDCSGVADGRPEHGRLRAFVGQLVGGVLLGLPER